MHSSSPLWTGCLVVAAALAVPGLEDVPPAPSAGLVDLHGLAPYQLKSQGSALLEADGIDVERRARRELKSLRLHLARGRRRECPPGSPRGEAGRHRTTVPPRRPPRPDIHSREAMSCASGAPQFCSDIDGWLRGIVQGIIGALMILELTPDQKAYRQTVAAFAAERVSPMAATIDDEGTFPGALIKEAAALGLLGVTIPRESGGAGLDYVSYALALEALGRASAVMSVIASVNNSLVAEPIAEFGTDAQKDRWLRRLASGDAIGAFALVGGAGGIRCRQPADHGAADDGGYVLNGRKVWVANAEAAEVAIVFAATAARRSPGRLSGRQRVPRSVRDARSDPSGARRIRWVSVVSVAWISSCVTCGSAPTRCSARPRDGFQIAMWALDGGRVAIAAQALGVGEAALDAAIAHAKQHEAFGQPIANYQAIQWMLADSATELDAARLLMLKAADARASRSGPTLEAAMAKLSASEAAHRAADRAMQILASHGYRRGSLVERLFRDVRATEIYQGTSEVQRMVIADQLGIASGRG